MVYSSKFVMCVLVDGQPLKEQANGMVQVPFDKEYVLRFRNKNNRRAVVKFTIDGEDASGPGYIIPANGHIDIPRFHARDAAFKFVSLDSLAAVEAGKNGLNLDKSKGVLEAKFYLEKQPEYTVYSTYGSSWYFHPFTPYPCSTYASGWYNPPQQPSFSFTTGIPSEIKLQAQDLPKQINVTMDSSQPVWGKTGEWTPYNNAIGTVNTTNLSEGCTVEGPQTGVNFVAQVIALETDFVALKLFLMGYDPHKETKDKMLKELLVMSGLAPSSAKSNLDKLEQENRELREKIARLENEQLKKRLDELQNS